MVMSPLQRYKYSTMKKQIKEDGVSMVGGAPANSVSGGQIDGLGVGPKGEPGVKPKKKKSVMPFKMFTRKPPK